VGSRSGYLACWPGATVKFVTQHFPHATVSRTCTRGRSTRQVTATTVESPRSVPFSARQALLRTLGHY
jgi:hypothetical protein